MYGYAGQILYVDLTKEKITKKELEEDFARKYLGGNGFGAAIMYKEIKQGIDPYSPENIICYVAGPVSGTFLHGAGRTGVMTKSPLTGGFADGYFGGGFGANLKFAGYDTLVIKGKAKKPVYIKIDDNEVSIENADHLWGKTTLEAQEIMRKDLGKDYETLSIGQGGENLVRYTTTIGALRSGGRGGTGSVAGSKNLKGVAVRGTNDVKVYDFDGLYDFFLDSKERYLKTLKGLTDYGTPILVNGINTLGGLGTRNWQDETFEGAETISGEYYKENLFVRHTACYYCRLGGCGKIFKGRGTVSEGPEYETLYSLGSCVGIDDAEYIVEADRLCDLYGIDTISMGVSIAFLMECYEKGLVSKDSVDGMDFSFGNGDTVIEAIKKTAYREGVGDLLAEGTKRMAQKIGKGSEKFAINVKGLEIAGHSPRALKSMSVGYATATRGGSHHDSRPTYEYGLKDKRTLEGKAKIAVDSSNWTTIGDSLIICHLMEKVMGIFLSENHVAMVNLVTGFGIDLPELTRIGERIYNVERAFNIREGFSRKDDTLPWRIMNEPIKTGGSKGAQAKPEELEKLLDQYYEMRGWQKDGRPSKEKLKELGLEHIIDDLY